MSRKIMFSESLLKGSKYLESSITRVLNDNFKCLCLPCQKKYDKGEIQFEGLRKHLNIPKYQATATKDKDRVKLKKALEFLDQKKNQKTSLQNTNSFSNPSQGSERIEEEFNENEMTIEEESQLEILEKTKERSKENKYSSQGGFRQFRLEVAGFFITNNLSFSLVERFMGFYKKLLLKYSVEDLSSFIMNRKHMNEIATHCVGPYFKEKYLAMLTNTPYSFSMDEGKTKDNVQYLAINARFLPNEGSTKTETRLLGMVQIAESQTGETIYKILGDFLFSGQEGHLRRRNLMGIATDGGRNMISSKGAGATNRLQAEFPYIIVVHDLCHALNLVLKSSILKFSKKHQKIIKKICSLFAQSPKQAAILKGIQMQNQISNQDSKVLQVLRLVETRWSSFVDCLSRILDIKESLITYFNQYGSQEEKEYLSSEKILMFKLLHCLTSQVHVYIKIFEEENIDIISLVRNLKECGALFGDYIYKITSSQSDDDYVDKDQLFKKLKPYFTQETNQEQYYESIKRNFEDFKVYFLARHPNFNNELASLSEENQNNFFNAAKAFLEEALLQLRDYLPWKDSQILLLADSFLLKTQYASTNLNNLAAQFSNIISKDELSLFNLETSRLTFAGLDVRKRIKKGGANYLEGWKQVEQDFPLIYRLARAIWTLPYSSASIERNFSVMGDIKTIKRNKLSLPNLEACLLTKQALSKPNESDEDAFSTTEILSRYSNIF